MWKALYDDFVQLLTVKHSFYMQQHGSPGRAVRTALEGTVYAQSGVVLLLTTLIVCILYYYYFNLRFGRYYSRTNWGAFALTGSILTGIITYLSASAALSKMTAPVTSIIIALVFINCLYSLILFLLLSSAMKWGSPMGKKTPF
jgi:hypothetical protein